MVYRVNTENTINIKGNTNIGNIKVKTEVTKTATNDDMPQIQASKSFYFSYHSATLRLSTKSKGKHMQSS